MKTEIEKYIKDRLEEWADWYGRGRDNYLGYPSKCTLARLIDGELLMNNNAGPKNMPTNERAEEIEKLVKEMAEQNYTMATVLRCQYFLHGSLRSKAKYLNKYLKISHTQFKYYVDMSEQWLAGRLSANIRGIALK